MSWFKKYFAKDIAPEDLDWENVEVVVPDEGAKLVRLPTGFNIATYNLQVFSPEVEPEKETSMYRWGEADKRVLADLPAMLELAEEELTTLLPEGYAVRITEWNK